MAKTVVFPLGSVVLYAKDGVVNIMRTQHTTAMERIICFEDAGSATATNLYYHQLAGCGGSHARGGRGPSGEHGQNSDCMHPLLDGPGRSPPRTVFYQ